MSEEKKVTKEKEKKEIKKKEEKEESKKVVKEVEKKKKPTDKMTSKISQENIISAIEGMTVLELSELTKTLEEKFGVKSAYPSFAPSSVGGEGVEEKKEEKTIFTVVLSEIGPNKIPVIKEVRAVTNLGLKESKDLVEAAPKTVKENVSKEEAEEIKKKLDAVGAKVELK